MIRLIYLTLFGLYGTLPCLSQEARVGIRFVPAPNCGQVESEIEGQHPTEEIKELIADLPRGRERDIALRLLKEVSGGGLQGDCNDPQGEESVETSVYRGEPRVTLGTRSLPEITADVSALPDDGGFAFGYRVSNKAEADAPVVTWGLMIPFGDHTMKMTHPTWRIGPSGMESDRMIGMGDSEDIQGVPLMGESGVPRWSAPSSRLVIQAGRSLSLFRVTSEFLPGWMWAHVGSDDTVEPPPGPLSDDVKDDLDILEGPIHHYSSVLTIGPKFGPDDSRPQIAADWNLGIQIMISANLLSESSRFIVELLESLFLIETSAPGAQVALKVHADPKSDMEILLHKAASMSLRRRR